MSFNTALLTTAITALTELSGAIYATDGTATVDGDQEARITDAKFALDPALGQFVSASEVTAAPSVAYKNVVFTATAFAAKVRSLVAIGCMSGNEVAQAAAILQSVIPDYEAM